VPIWRRNRQGLQFFVTICSVPRPGELLSRRYRVTHHLPGVGAAEIYVARDTVLEQRLVIIKMPPVEATPTEIERFRREISVMCALYHPHVVAILDAIDVPRLRPAQNGEKRVIHPGIVLELLNQSLEALLDKKGYLGWQHALHMIRQVALGLHHVHSLNIVHRDIKPANVLLVETVSGNEVDFLVKIADFGITWTSTHGDKRLTRTGYAIGTEDYMSPEQARAVTIDHRSDFFSLGVTLFEMLTGDLPLLISSKHEGRRIPFWHIAETPPTPSIHAVGHIPTAVEELTTRLLAPNPDGRPETALEIIEAVDAILLPPPESESKIIDLATPTTTPGRITTPHDRTVEVHVLDPEEIVYIDLSPTASIACSTARIEAQRRFRFHEAGIPQGVREFAIGRLPGARLHLKSSQDDGQTIGLADGAPYGDDYVLESSLETVRFRLSRKDLSSAYLVETMDEVWIFKTTKSR